MRRLLGLCLMLLLGACNRVITDAPLFFAADAQGAPVLREGVWLIDEEPDCPFDAREPVAAWPDCADWVLIRDGEMLGFDEEKGEKNGQGEWQSIPFVLAAGDPPVLQLALLKEEIPGYWYFGVEPTRLDDEGRVTAFVSWPVLCGPPPPEPRGEEPRFVTLEPLPGMTIRDQNCTTDQPQAVRAAARVSRAWESDTDAARWVKARYP